MSPEHQRPSARVRPIDFFIVGAPRSGTTLARRLASELPGVVVSPETHFMPRYHRRAVWQRFPMGEDALRDVAARFMAGLRADLDTEALLAVLGGRADTPQELFAGIVRSYSPGAAVVGEKTPAHVRYWRELVDWYPEAKLIGLVRDPRHQVASQRHEDWGTDRLLLAAARWRDDNRALLEAKAELATTLLLVHHHELAATPDIVRSRIADHLGIDDHAGLVAPDPSGSGEVQAWRQIDPSRATHRSGELSASQERAIAAICRREMRALDFDPTPSWPGVVGDAAATIALARAEVEERVRDRWKVVRRRIARGDREVT